MAAVHRVEFTIEPFVEGRPGPHVTAAIDAVRHLGIAVDVGPFGSACDVPSPRVGEVVAALSQVAVDQGASHLNIDVADLGPPTRAAR
jgi:uncharacterized protein YqgV (UPF0045/DUF77 family)